MAPVTVTIVGFTSNISARSSVLLLIIDEMCLLHLADLDHLTPKKNLRQL